MTDTPEEPTASTPATEPVAEVESETAADFSPPAAGDAAPGTETSGTEASVDTVTRKSAALAMAVCLLVGGAVGWLGAGAFDDDDDGVPISAFGEGGGERGEGRGGFPGGGRGPGGGFPGGGFPEGGFPEGGFPGGPMGPGGGIPGEQGEGWGDGDHPMPPWADGSEDDDDRGEDDGGQDDGDQDDQDDRGDGETPSSTTES